jgi:phosphoglycolate phosphatase-like HAD superfamily hydrolase
LLDQHLISLLQEVVVDRKRLFVVTNGNPLMQLNKIRQTDWQGMENYLTCYFAEETAPKPEPDSIHQLLSEQGLHRRDLVMIGNATADRLCAEACGIDYFNADAFK